MKKKSYKIDLEIYVVFIMVIGISVFNAIYSSLTISRNQDVNSRIITVEIPSLQALENMNLLVTRSKMYTTNWVYLHGNRDDKEKLKELHASEYPELKGDIKAMMTSWNDQENVDSMNAIFRSFDNLLIYQKQIMNTLVSFDDYEDPMKKFAANDIIESQLLPQSTNIINRLNSVIMNKKGQSDVEHYQMRASSRNLMWSVLTIAILIVIVVLIAGFYMSNNIIVPTMKLKNVVLLMGKGEIPEVDFHAKKNAIGQMTEAVQSLSESLRRTAHFAHSVGAAKFDEEFQPLSENDELGNALIQMRASLKNADEENRHRNWFNNGMAMINEALRENTDNIDKLTDEIISKLVKYVLACHGAIYLIEQKELNGDKWIQLHGSYALDERTRARQRLGIGEGLIGQAIKEDETIYLKNIPNTYTIINSGLGESPATHAVIVPLKYHGKVYGAFELASFNHFPDFQIRFLETMGETIASTIHSVKANTLTKNLLEETRKQAERLSLQEDELRKTNEELSNQSTLLQASEEGLRQSNLELKRKARELEQQNEILEQAREALSIKAGELETNNKFKSEFLANMSHELRTPLNSILILARLLAENKDKNLTGKQIEYSQVIHKSGNDLLALINDILDLSKIEAGKVELILEPAKLKEMRSDILSLFGELAIEKKIEFDVEFTSDLPDTIVTDSVRLSQIIKNLLSNAFKFTPAGGKVILKMKMAGRDHVFQNPELIKTNKIIEFSVSDTGIGIPAEKQQLIFEAFQQADGSTNRKYGGTGLGLSISKMLVSMLGGEIHLTSEQGKGSTFTIYFPYKKEIAKISGETVTASEDVVLSSSLKNTVHPDRANESSFSFSGEDDRRNIGVQDKVILIVEDDIHFARILLDIAHEKKYKAIIATQGDEGLNYASEYHPSAIIMDMQLPGMDGWSVLKKIRQDSNLCNTPVHIMSAMDRKKITLEMGATTYLQKPLDKKDLDLAFINIKETIEVNAKRILIIEDSEIDQQIVSSLIAAKEENAQIFIAVNKEDAIEKLRQNKFDFIILDLNLGHGKQEGIDLLGIIRKNQNSVDTPVIVYTAEELDKVQESIIKENAINIIHKNGMSADQLVKETVSFLQRLQHREVDDVMTIPPAHSDEILRGRQVLLADDDMRNLFALTSVLENQGLKVITAVNGKEILEKLEQNPGTEIVLTDIMMPEMDGYLVIQKIRKIDKYINLPIIAMTALAMAGDREKCIQCGATDYISKPVNTEQLLSLMRVWLYNS